MFSGKTCNGYSKESSKSEEEGSRQIVKKKTGSNDTHDADSFGKLVVNRF